MPPTDGSIVTVKTLEVRSDLPAGRIGGERRVDRDREVERGAAWRRLAQTVKENAQTEEVAGSNLQ